MPKTAIPTKYYPEETITSIEEQWIKRCKSQHYVTKGKRYQQEEFHFFLGAVAGMLALNPSIEPPVGWALMLSCGRRIIDEERFK